MNQKELLLVKKQQPQVVINQQQQQQDQLLQQDQQPQQELEELQAKRATTLAMQEKLTTDGYIEQQAKEQLNMVNPGEEAYNILPAATDPIGLPEGWPFTGVERVFGAR